LIRRRHDELADHALDDGIEAFALLLGRQADAPPIDVVLCIVDASNLEPATIYPKMWEEQDPSAVFTMSQSAPLMVPTNPNNSFKIRVQS
jgi:predicted cation transporter